MTMTIIEQTDSPTVATGIDALQLAALRKADKVCFFHRSKPDATGETSYIDCGKRHKPSPIDPFAPDETHVIIPVDFRLREYTRGDDKIPFDCETWNAFEWIGYAQSHEEWRTIVSLLRVGDKLTLFWQRGAWTTESMINASPAFYGDSLSLIVDRAKATLQFHIDMSVCENNSARMIRRA
jgi:hypothetical protein